MNLRQGALLAAAVLMVAVAGCSTTASGIKNPNYANRTLSDAAVLVVNSDLDLGLKLEKDLVSQLEANHITAIGITKEVQFVTNESERAALRKRLVDSGVKEVVYVALGDISQSDIAGYQLTGTANAYGNTAYSSGSAIPVRTFTRDMTISCRIDDLSSRKTIWKGASRRHAQGLLFIGDGSMISNAVTGLVDELKKEGVL